MVSDPSGQPKNVAIIGAGPAGLMAAEVIAARGHAVTIYERMPSPARKFLLAGRGGLNLTHSEPLDIFLQRYGDAASIVRDAVVSYPPERLIAWANALGQETFIGSSGRVFPKAMKASPLLRAWLRKLNALGVSIKTRHTWHGFAGDGGLAITDSTSAALSIKPDAAILALGGASWPRLGSDGAWVQALRAHNIAVADLEAANCGVRIAWSDVFAGRFAGSPLKRIAIHVGDSSARGEAIITGSGLEGGVIYALSRDIRAQLRRTPPTLLTIDLKPDTGIADLTARLSRPRGSQPLSNFIRKAANLDAAAIGLLREAGALPTEPAALAERIKAVTVPVTGLADIGRAISTAGGVELGELTPAFMLATKPGVFVAGEMADWEAPTGGYLLQASFATGVAAATGVQQWLERASSPATLAEVR